MAEAMDEMKREGGKGKEKKVLSWAQGDYSELKITDFGRLTGKIQKHEGRFLGNPFRLTNKIHFSSTSAKEESGGGGGKLGQDRGGTVKKGWRKAKRHAGQKALASGG